MNLVLKKTELNIWQRQMSRRQHRPLHTTPTPAFWELRWRLSGLGSCSLWSPQFLGILGMRERQRVCSP